MERSRFRRVFGGQRRTGPSSRAPKRLVDDSPATLTVVHDRSYSSTLVHAAKELGKPVADVTATDLLDFQTEDLPEGPSSELGGEVRGPLDSRPESETRRLAAIGRALVDEVYQNKHAS